MERVGLLGTGIVGRTLAARLAELGVDVVVGARSAESSSLEAFADLDVRTGSFADAAAHADLVVNATNGVNSTAVLESIGAEALAGKTVVDLSNELVPREGGGFPVPTATAESSVGRRLQEAFPETYVVKSLNTMNCAVMADPSIVPGDHVVFLSGDDAGAKDRVRELLATFGWRPEQMVDLGGIETASATEMMMSVWMAVTIARGHDAPRFNWAVNAP
ncbi:NADPH-dependent F420 reductase [Aeromicrobium terrae]|uniref:NADP oxidoreductase n=1 Tax=Aeromicrobium terrae TaxID=2498846 RepID=A0A5C8NMF5_9ACTN|nr:NAD(P)-binding domain-containing protein [Aeromicrobium terrae]TXL62368.1 NADP oxidoreductase [Aeromicrobium terrae]